MPFAIDSIRLSSDQRSREEVKTLGLTRRLFGLEGELALKNLKRNRRRYRATIFSLFISIVLFISFSTFINYAFRSTDLYYLDIPFDLSIFAGSIPLEEQKGLYEMISNLEGVERCSMFREMVTEAWLSRDQFGSYLQKNYIDEGGFQGDEEGRFRCYVHLVALGDAEFRTYALENGFNTAYFREPKISRDLVNKNIGAGGETLANTHP